MVSQYSIIEGKANAKKIKLFYWLTKKRMKMYEGIGDYG